MRYVEFIFSLIRTLAAVAVLSLLIFTEKLPLGLIFNW